MKIIYRLLILMLCANISLAQSQNQPSIPSLKAKLQKATQDSTRMNCYLEICEQFMESNLDSTYFYLKKGEEISKRISDKRILMVFNQQFAKYYFLRNMFISSETYLKKAIKIANEIHDNEHIIRYTISLTAILGEVGKSQESIQKSLELISSMNKKDPNKFPYLFHLNINLALHCISLKNYGQALMYSQKAGEFMQTRKDSIVYYKNLARAYQKLNRYAESINSGEKGLTLSNKINNSFEIIDAKLIIADSYKLLKDYPQALKYSQEALTESNVSGQLKFESIIVVGSIYNEMKQYEKALALYQGIIPELKKNENYYNLQSALDNIHKTYALIGDYKNAYLTHLESTQLAEKQAGRDKQKIVSELEAQYELNEKQAQIASQELENKLQLQRIETARKQQIVFISLLIAVILLLILAIWNYHKKYKLSQELIVQRNNVEKQAQLLTETNKTKDKLFAVIGHDLRSPIANLVNSLTLWQGDENGGITEQKKGSFSQVNIELENVQVVLNNLLQWANLQIKESAPRLQPIVLKTLVKSVLNQFETSFRDKNITAMNDVQDYQILADELQMQIVIRNLLSNALKFTKEGGFIRITSEENTKDKTISISVRDTGVGIKPEQLENVFQFPSSQVGTNGEKGTGIGLSLCKELVENNHGIMSIKSVLGKGTEVSFTILKVS